MNKQTLWEDFSVIIGLVTAVEVAGGGGKRGWNIEEAITVISIDLFLLKYFGVGVVCR